MPQTTQVERLKEKLFKNCPQKGFTLIELLISITIIGVLATIGIITYNSVQKTVRVQNRVRGLENVKVAIEAYKSRKGEYPKTQNKPNVGHWYTECNPRRGTTPNDDFDPAETTFGWYQKPRDQVVPGLVPEYINALPRDPLFNAAAPDPSDPYCILYQSDGADYKLLHFVKGDMNNGDFIQYKKYIDPRYDSQSAYDNALSANWCLFDYDPDPNVVRPAYGAIWGFGIYTSNACTW